MLDFQKVINQIKQVGQESLIDGKSQLDILDSAIQTLNNVKSKPELMAKRLQDNINLALWPIAVPLEPIGKSFEIGKWTEPATVVATDGSQIMPSHHEVYNCYLLNIGYTVISYGKPLPAKLDTIPTLFHRSEELYPLVNRRRVHIDELYVSLERNLLEIETLFQLANTSKDRGLPVLALIDGTLIPWSVEKMPDGYKESYIQRMIKILDGFKQEHIPLIGYLSHSRSSDVINDLRVCICPYKVSNCREFCGNLNEEEFPCSKIWPLADRKLHSKSFPKGFRSNTFLSGANILNSFTDDQKICFVYMNIGHETARLEFPKWLFEDSFYFPFALQNTYLQAEKGIGYPICLAEAHYLAVIKGQERKQFFDLLAAHLVELGVEPVMVSPKENRKRQTII